MQIVTALGPRQERLDGIDRAEVKMLNSFLGLFLKETTKLEGEDYPTLHLVLLSQARLDVHCQQPVRRPQDEDGYDYNTFYPRPRLRIENACRYVTIPNYSCLQ